ncbi:unnamed protein product [Heterobilharzia americana]|nr:unnamed protein product [Heterobilharzia americana]
MSIVYGISLSVPRYLHSKVSHTMPVNNNFNEHDTILLQPQFDKIRIVILAGLNNDELISTEITIRLLRHLCTGLDSSSPEIWRILATSQLLIFPYLDPIGIHKSLSRVKEKQNIVYQSRSTCGSTSEFSDSRSVYMTANKRFPSFSAFISQMMLYSIIKIFREYYIISNHIWLFCWNPTMQAIHWSIV